MAHTFKLNKESLKREFAVYVVIIIIPKKKIILYVGKTGDNMDGCNVIISRCGNHFSYSGTAAQIRKIVEKEGENVEECDYIYVFDHFDKYVKGESEKERRDKINKINEMERWLYKEIKEKVKNCDVADSSIGTVRDIFRTKENELKIKGIVDTVNEELKITKYMKQFIKNNWFKILLIVGMFFYLGSINEINKKREQRIEEKEKCIQECYTKSRNIISTPMEEKLKKCDEICGYLSSAY